MTTKMTDKFDRLVTSTVLTALAASMPFAGVMFVVQSLS